MEILDLKETKHSTDGRLIAISFETDVGPIEITANTSTMGFVIQQIASIVWAAKKLNPSTILSIPSPKTVQVQPTKNRDGVVIRFLMANDMEFLFALPTIHARQFRDRLDVCLPGDT